MKFTKEQAEECKRYLGNGFKHGCFSLDFIEEIIKNKDWEQVYKLIDYGDHIANSWEENI